MKYKHDCENCQFLGNYKKYDVYFCPTNFILQPEGGFIFRYGNLGHEYESYTFKTVKKESEVCKYKDLKRKFKKAFKLYEKNLQIKADLEKCMKNPKTIYIFLGGNDKLFYTTPEGLPEELTEIKEDKKYI